MRIIPVLLLCMLLQMPTLTAEPKLNDNLLAAFGLNVAGASQTYGRNTLFDYINGGADVYLDAGFKSCTMRRYKNTGGVDIEAAIYDIGTFLNSFGLFRLLHEEFSIDTAAGIEIACVTSASYFRNDRYYVTILDRSRQPLKETGLLAISRIVSATIGKGVLTLPEGFEKFPSRFRVPRSESFHATNYMARSFMKNVLTARFCPDKDTVTLFMMEASSEKAARTFLEKLHKQFAGDNSTIATLKPEGLPGFQADNIRIVRSRNSLVGLRGEGANNKQALAILKESLERLR